MTVGTFTIVKNEAPWIRAHILSWLPWIDQAVFFDGNSTDGTLEIIKDISASHPFGKRITLVEDRDVKDLDQDYQRVFNDCLRTLTTDYAVFAHPDMFLDDPGNLAFLGDAPAYTMNLRSFAGEPGQQLYEVVGRAQRWKNIYRLRNPDLGLHYFGAYGSPEEDCYFSKITGSEHEFYGQDFDRYPYDVKDSAVRVWHFSDVRSIERRTDRMVKCLINQGNHPEIAAKLASIHPRVTLKDGYGLKFIHAQYPAIYTEGVAA